MADKGKNISSELIEQKLVLFNSSQESVQAMSLWIMHNKSHHQKIVDTWLKVLKKSDSKHKLTLFYLCNDVVQHAKKKKALYYLENFKDHLREAVLVVREFESIKPNIERIFKIWEDRKTYDAKFVKELRTVMEGGSSSKGSSASGTPAIDSPAYKPSTKAEKASDKIIAKPVEETPDIAGEFKPTTFVEQMAGLKKLEGDVTLKAKQLAALRIDATSIEAVKQLKDRSHGNEFCRQFEESCVKIEDYVAMLEKEIRQRRTVLSLCEGAEDFYFSQFDEAKVVANAYKNFGARVTNMKKRVDDMKKIIPATPSPVPSPTVDAPSPGNSPTLPDMDDNETVDMDLCNEDTEQSKHGQDAAVKGVSAGNQKAPGNASSTFQGTNILESRIATMLPNLAKGNSNMPPGMAPAGVGGPLHAGMGGPPPGGTVAPPGGMGPPADMFPPQNPPVKIPDMYTPPPRHEQAPAQSVVKPPQTPPRELVDDTGSSTPVLDEQEEKELTPPPKPAPKVETKTKTNPIDFLSQLLTKTSSSSSSSNFLQTLSLLTNTVKTQYQKKQNEDVDVAKSVEDTRAPSPNFSVGVTGSTHSGGQEFTGVPAPDPTSPTASWTGWKQVSAAQPDPSSPPIISQNKHQDISHPPLPQRPPPPPEPLPPQPYNLQPPSPQDFSMPPPMVRPNVSQSFLNPPHPIRPNSQPFGPNPNSAPFPSAAPFPPQVTSSSPFSNQPAVLSTSVEPTNIGPRPPGVGFNPAMPYGLVPQGSGPGPMARPPPPMQVNQLPPGFMPARMELVRPPGQPAPFMRGPAPYAPPPPPPDTGAPPQWQQQQQQQPPDNNSRFGNQISSVPVSQPEWGNQDNEPYDDPSAWEPDESDSGNQSGGYAHPWDQPQNYDEEEDDTEFVDEILETSLPPPPKKSILRNRMSSLREVTLVEETNTESSHVSEQNNPPGNQNVTHIIPQVRDHKPAGILKRPPTDIKPVNSQNDNTQSEFINILKQKSGANANLPDPPSGRVQTSTSAADFAPAEQGKDSTGHSHGETINTIGVLGKSGRPSSVQSDDMDIDTDDRDFNGNNEEVRTWKPQNDWSKPRESLEPQEELPADYDSPGGPPPRPQWHDHNEHHEQHGGPRSWQPRAQGYDRGGFHPRGGFTPRPRFQDNFRGPSPAKRPFFSPRQRMPYYRY